MSQMCLNKIDENIISMCLPLWTPNNSIEVEKLNKKKDAVHEFARTWGADFCAYENYYRQLFVV